MDKILKNQKLLFLSIFGGILFLSLCWYYLIHRDLSKQYNRSTTAMLFNEQELKKFKSIESQLTSMQREWETINTEFITLIDKIPDKRLYESVTDFIYSMIINHGLKVEKFEPSQSTVEKKTILMPETGSEITVEKIPIDVNLKGSFINFGQLLESMTTGRYRLTASSIEILKKKTARDQTIKFICYAYFQSQLSKPIASKNAIIKKTTRKNSPNSTLSDNVNMPTKNIKKVAVLDDKLKVMPDSLEGVPEMWLEPATEPVDESVVAETTVPGPEPKKQSNNNKPKAKEEKKAPPVKKAQKQVKTPEPKKTKNFYDTVEVLNSIVCKKVKNNQPLYPGKRFPTDIGRVYCHSLINNNSDKHNDIYHIWYMNGNLKAKVRIRVRNGQEIPAVSHREVANSDRGTWKIEITDSDKKILDTVIFEVV